MLNNFEEYIDSLFDAFNNPLPILWEYEEPMIFGKFVSNNQEYKIVAEYIIHDFLTFKFKKKIAEDVYTTDIHPDSTKNYIRVIPTIKESLIFLLEKISPKGVVFAATDSSKGRKMVYDRFVNEYLKNNTEYDFFCKKDENSDTKIYLVFKKNTNNAIKIDVFDYLIKNKLNL
jgi:hypothetical protein